MKSNDIMETLKIVPLSDEEKTKKHIIGRLYGPIATCTESTRNGRLYNRQLWEKALNDDIFKEKVANKSLFLELGHPADRTETDMTKICACIPELPKIIGNDLYAYVDILDTQNGKLLKMLCDYGFVPGISSRGSGDVDEYTNEVDPETFFLETWDIVQLPAVKKARMTVCESLENNGKDLRKALNESYNSASDKDKQIMKEALDNLDIKLDEDKRSMLEEYDLEEEASNDTKLNEEKISNDGDYIIADDGRQIPIVNDENDFNRLIVNANDKELLHEDDTEDQDEDQEEINDNEEVKELEAAEDKTDEVEEVSATTVGELVGQLEDLDKDTPIVFNPIIIDERVYNIEQLEVDPDSFKDKVIVNVGYSLADSKESENDNIDEVQDDESNKDPKVDTEITDDQSAIDDGEDETVIENLKEMIRQKDLLTQEVKALKEERAVRNAEVNTLKEELSKYKTSFVRVSAVASESKKFETENNNLREQLKTKSAQIKTLETKAANAANESKKLNESINSNANQVKVLKEELNKVKADSNSTITKLNEQLANYKTQFAKRTQLAKDYKAKYNNIIEKYVNSKATMLGVAPAEITSRLKENYTIDDIDKVCDSLLENTNNFNRLPFGFNQNTKIRIQESASEKNRKVNRDPDAGYDIDDSLLELAGLK